MAALTAASLAISLWNVDAGSRSEYYAAVARSMSMSWRNLLFGAMDPAGVLSVDKIPGSFVWMALSVRMLGMSTFAVLLPNAIATALTAVVVATSVRRWRGDVPGLIAGALFALTPVVAAVARSNQPHVIFVLLLALAADRAIVAVQRGSRRSLIAAGLWIAAAFQSYMLAAWALWPSIIAAWLVAAPASGRRRARDLVVAGSVSVLASLAWIVLVTITPSGSRPWVGGSDHDSAIEMVFGYNGLGRFGHTSGTSFRTFSPSFGGPAGLGRLVNSEMGGQIAWLLPAAFASLLLVLWEMRRLRHGRRGVAVLVIGWFLTFAAMDSLSAGIHQFYAAALAPALAALVAAGVDIARGMRRPVGAAVLVGVLAATAGFAFVLAGRTPRYLPWAPWVQCALAAIVAWVILQRGARRVTPFVLVAALAWTPTVWAIDVVHHPNPMNPVAGPSDADAATQGPASDVLPTDREAAALVDWLQPRTVGARFRFATLNGITAAPYIATTGARVLPIGGFDGSDPFPTLARLRAWVASGDVRYVLVDGRGVAGPQTGPTDRVIRAWVLDHCAAVAAAPAVGLRRCARG